MNTKKPKIVMLAVIFSLVILLPVLLNVSANTQTSGAAGSIDDPLVTAGYVAKYVTEILNSQEQKINSSMQSMIQEAVNKAMGNQSISISSLSEVSEISETPETSELSGNAVGLIGSGNGSYELLTLNKNEKIRSKSGTLEVILRPGAEAKVMSEHQDLGLADITVGQEILHAETAPINHTLLIPRADGRGLFITSDIAYIFARGDYEIYE